MKTKDFKKVYYHLKQDESGYYWRGQDGSRIYFTGHPKFIVKSLVKLYGAKEGEDIFTKFMNGVANISQLPGSESRPKGPACFTLYKARYENQNYEQGAVQEVQDRDERHSEEGKTSGEEDMG